MYWPRIRCKNALHHLRVAPSVECTCLLGVWHVTVYIASYCIILLHVASFASGPKCGMCVAAWRVSGDWSLISPRHHRLFPRSGPYCTQTERAARGSLPGYCFIVHICIEQRWASVRGDICQVKENWNSQKMLKRKLFWFSRHHYISTFEVLWRIKNDLLH